MNDQDNDDELFREEMAGVKPLTQGNGKQGQRRVQQQTPGLDARRRAAVAAGERAGDGLSGEQVEPVKPNATLSYKKDGLQHGVFKKLRLGHYQIDARLDLHRMKVEQARQAVFQFIQDCMKHNIRCVLITHGKGEGRAQPALLKSHVAHWLPQLDSVLAFHSAQPHHGGSGATYVMLRKSEEKRQENLERHQARRGGR